MIIDTLIEKYENQKKEAKSFLDKLTIRDFIKDLKELDKQLMKDFELCSEMFDERDKKIQELEEKLAFQTAPQAK